MPLVHPEEPSASGNITDGFSLEVGAKDIAASAQASPHREPTAPALPQKPCAGVRPAARACRSPRDRCPACRGRRLEGRRSPKTCCRALLRTTFATCCASASRSGSGSLAQRGPVQPHRRLRQPDARYLWMPGRDNGRGLGSGASGKCVRELVGCLHDRLRQAEQLGLRQAIGRSGNAHRSQQRPAQSEHGADTVATFFSRSPMEKW